MPSRFPHGISSMGMPILGTDSLIPASSGTYFWVDSGNPSGTGSGDFDDPYTTLAAAYAACTTGEGDVIIMKVGHAETISVNTALTLSKSGVFVIGLGSGALRPTITLTGTTAAVTIAVSGANQTFRNFIVSCGVDELVAAFTISAAGCTIDAVDWVEASASYQAITFITTTAGGTRLTVKNCHLVQVTAPAGNGACITLVGADDGKILNNFIWWISSDAAASGAIAGITTASLRLFIADNMIVCPVGTSVVPVSIYAASSGYALRNTVGCGKTLYTGAIALAGMYGAENRACNTVNTAGQLDPVLDPATSV